MERFEEVQEGDAVYSRIVGDGIVIKVFTEDMYKMRVRFDSGYVDIFTIEGKASPSHIEPTLFYRKGEERYLEKRPELEIDWSKVPTGPKGVMVRVRDFDDEEFSDPKPLMAYIPDYRYSYFVAKQEFAECLMGFKQAELVEPCKPEWVKRCG